MSDSFDESPPSSPVGDQTTEVSTESWGQQILGGFVAFLLGLVLIPAAIVLLYWNEGRAVDAIRAIGRGAASVIEINASPINPASNGHLVHVTGMMQPGTPARDPDFGVTGDGLTRLERKVEMFQWKEEKETESHGNLGGSKTTATTYKYAKVWSDAAIASGAFHNQDGHQNPAMPAHSATFDGTAVMVGAYRLDPPVLGKITDFTPLHPSVAPPAGYQAAGEGFYRGQDPAQPAIGDLRVTFRAVPAQTVSVVAAQVSGTLTAWRDANGYTIALAEPGMVTAQALFKEEAHAAGVMTWILRAVGFAMVLVGFLCLARPLTTLFAVVPFLESLVGAGAFLVALTLAVPVTLLTIAIAWLAHRPLIGVGLIAAAAIGAYGLRQLHPRKT
jgi:hypothetical protein